MQLLLDTHTSPIGEMYIVTDEAGVLRALDFEDYQPRMHKLLQRHYGEYTLSNQAAPESIKLALEAYFEGEIEVLKTLTTATNGTPFQLKVWKALQDIPAGETWSYGTLAQAVGNPKGSRAVGLANGANPIAIVVPCHRVIGANGALTGYGGGVWRKRWLLEHEAALMTGSLL
ncbi:methylated-DNA--[protein]-cysteine S-methyltransferase [Nitrincola sp. MINF-07-Sa-05]|uniref:methylated-DNA--[protein]-cysteine S-methyltransferase n=1 Tax=Nitrincola salilacus TaxID=3400273 RepID=UPI00391846B0